MTANAIDLRGAKQIAHHFGVTDRTIRRWSRKGLIKVEKIGGRTSPLRMSIRDDRRVEGDD